MLASLASAPEGATLLMGPTATPGTVTVSNTTAGMWFRVFPLVWPHCPSLWRVSPVGVARLAGYGGA